MQLTGEDKKKLRKRPTENNEAYKLLLMARHTQSRLSPETVRRAIVLCEQAIDIDPTYALAHARLSSLCTGSAMIGYVPAGEFYPRARAAAQRALELDETLADAHSSLGSVLLNQDWDFSAAEREFRRSVELSPDHWAGYAGLATLNRYRGRFDDAIAALRRPRDLDPIETLALRLNLGFIYYFARRFDSAIEQFRKVLEVEPRRIPAHNLIASAYACLGQREKALEECERP